MSIFPSIFAIILEMNLITENQVKNFLKTSK